MANNRRNNELIEAVEAIRYMVVVLLRNQWHEKTTESQDLV